MFRNLTILAVLSIAVICPTFVLGAGEKADDLAKGFAAPPDSARPWVCWMWMDGTVTREGITADLESMKRAGIGGVLVTEVSQQVPKGPVRFMSPPWRDLFRHMLAEAGRLGIEVSVNNDAGITGSGGPWIKPEQSMQKVVFSETILNGPIRFSEQLPQPPTMEGFYRDIAVLAFPTLEGDDIRMTDLAVKLTRSDGQKDVSVRKLFDNNPLTALELVKPDANRPDPNSRANFIRFEFARPFSACSLKLGTHGFGRSFQGVLQISEDGNTFKDVREFSVSTPGGMVTFDKVLSRYYRIAFTAAGRYGDAITLTEAELFATPRIEDLFGKAAFGRLNGNGAALGPAIPTNMAIDPNGIVDLTSQMDATGRLTWDVPRGKWTIVRFGYTSTGERNASAPVEGVGLECDKLSKEAVTVHFGEYAAKLLADQAKLAAKPIVSAAVNGWEVGSQNWTPLFRKEFEKRRGYDLLAYMPVMTGRAVESAEASERFLRDVRMTVGELVTENYAAQLQQFCRQQGVQLSVGAYGDGTFDSLAYAGRSDVPMGEFWMNRPDLSCPRTMASAAHVYGKPVVAAQAFKAAPEADKWQSHPFLFKTLGDQAFCEGVNRFIFHCYTMQPWLDRKPGMTMGAWGVHYDRTATWWEFSRPWHEYLSRCQFLLQRGQFVADVCYLQGEDVSGKPRQRGQLNPVLPQGYDYDECPAELAATMTVKDGRVVLPSGMSYRVLAIGPEESMSLTLLGKIKELVSAGATVVGPRPIRAPGLKDYPKCDDAVKTLAAGVWGDCDGKAVKERVVGKGKIVCGKPLGEVLAAMGAGPDFHSEIADANKVQLSYSHRIVGDADVYFVASALPVETDVACEFRVQGKRAEFWWPESGRIERAADVTPTAAGLRVPLHLDSSGSVFVVFRPEATPAPELMASRIKFGKPVEVAGSWEVLFPTKSGLPDRFTLNKLISWPEIKEITGKYFSGTATYRKELLVPDELLAKGLRLYLDLGKVQVIAQVKLNDKDLGILWKPPFRIDITDAAKAGANVLDIQVANLWPNRLIGDEQLPPDAKWKGSSLMDWPRWVLEGKPSPTGRRAFATWMYYKKESLLLESGLIGPVQLQAGVGQAPAPVAPTATTRVATTQAATQPATQAVTQPAAAVTQPALPASCPAGTK